MSPGEIPSWVPPRGVSRGGAVVCLACQAPYVLCGAYVHDPEWSAKVGPEITALAIRDHDGRLPGVPR